MSGRSQSILRKYLCLINWLPLHCRKYKKKAGMETSAPEFSTCHCYEVARGGCAVIASETGSKLWPPPALYMSELTPGAAAPHPSQPEPEQGCDPGALPSWLASCEMSPATPTVWMSSFKGKYGKASLSCKLSCSLSAPLNILVAALCFSLHAATALLSSDAAAASVSPAIVLSWVHFCMQWPWKAARQTCCSEMLCAHPLRKQRNPWRQPWCKCSRKRWPDFSNISSVWIQT